MRPERRTRAELFFQTGPQTPSQQSLDLWPENSARFDDHRTMHRSLRIMVVLRTKILLHNPLGTHQAPSGQPLEESVFNPRGSIRLRSLSQLQRFGSNCQDIHCFCTPPPPLAPHAHSFCFVSSCRLPLAATRRSWVSQLVGSSLVSRMRICPAWTPSPHWPSSEGAPVC